MNCSNCGNNVTATDTVCRYCGARVRGTSAARRGGGSRLVSLAIATLLVAGSIAAWMITTGRTDLAIRDSSQEPTVPPSSNVDPATPPAAVPPSVPAAAMPSAAPAKAPTQKTPPAAQVTPASTTRQVTNTEAAGAKPRATDQPRGPAPPAGDRAAGSTPVRAGRDIPAPAKLRDVPAAYPPLAVQARVQGVVIIEATLAPDGGVSAARVIRSAHALLDEAALTAVRQWQYAPTLLNGVPVPVILTVTVNFSLK